MARKIGAIAEILARAHEEDLDAALPARAMHADEIGIADAGHVDVLVRLDGRHGADAVAQHGGAFVIHGFACRLHLLGQQALGLLGAAGQESARLIHQLAVFGLVHDPHAGAGAALDLIEEAGPRADVEHAIGAGAQQKRALQHGERFIDGAGRGERPEILALAGPRPPVFHDARKRVIAGDQDVGEGFVVAQQDVVARRQPFDQIGLEQQRLGLRVGGHELHGARLRHHAADAHRLARQIGVARHPFFQVFRFAHIERLAGGIQHAVDARRRRRGLEMRPDRLDTGDVLHGHHRRRASRALQFVVVHGLCYRAFGLFSRGEPVLQHYPRIMWIGLLISFAGRKFL